jgi:uncharacterized protein YbaP (TraB family)
MWKQFYRRALFAFVLLSISSQLYGQIAALSAVPQPKPHRFLMWKVTSPTTTVYIVGSFHIARKDVYPLPAAVETAFASSKVLAVEVDIRKTDQSKMLQFIQRHGVYSPGDSLSKHLPPGTSAALDAFCQKYALPRANLEPLKPWVVTTMVAVFPLVKAGGDPKQGIDMHFLDEVKPTQQVDELESADFQLSLLSSASEQEELQVLAYTLKVAHEWESREEAYLSGDVDAILQQLAEFEPKSYSKRLIGERNPPIAEKVATYLKGKNSCFVVVGAGHVIGENGIVKLLEAKNYKVEQLAYEW